MEKPRRIFETQEQREADRIDEIKTTSYIIAILLFLAGCMIFNLLTQQPIIKRNDYKTTNSPTKEQGV